MGTKPFAASRFCRRGGSCLGDLSRHGANDAFHIGSLHVRSVKGSAQKNLPKRATIPNSLEAAPSARAFEPSALVRLVAPFSPGGHQTGHQTFRVGSPGNAI